MTRRHGLAGALAILLTLFPLMAAAYVGPGAGLGMIGSLVAVVVAVVMAIAGLLLLPFRLLRKRLQQGRASGSKDGQDDNSVNG